MTKLNRMERGEMQVNKGHFLRAAMEIGQSGDNDTLPYDIDAAFVKDKADTLSTICFDLFQTIDALSIQDAAKYVNGLTIGAERLLAPSGSHVRNGRAGAELDRSG